MLFEKWAANRLAMLESTPRRLLCLREPFSQQSSRVRATLDNVGQYLAKGDLVTRPSTSLNQLSSVFSAFLPPVYFDFASQLSIR